MVFIKDIYKFIDNIAPFDTALNFDNVGLLVGNMDDSIKKVLISLDITRDVVLEAQSFGADLIISHHPVIFNPIKNIDFNSTIHLLCKFSISALCAHTNLDLSEYGVNKCLADALNLKNIEPLCIEKSIPYKKIIVFSPPENVDDIINSMSKAGAGYFGNYCKCNFRADGFGSFLPLKSANPYVGSVGEYETTREIKIEMICPARNVDNVIGEMLKVHPYEEPAFDIFDDNAIKNNISMGVVGEISFPMNIDLFAKFVKERLHCNGLRYTDTVANIHRVAVCGGAGGVYVHNAHKKNADVFITGEIKHNLILDANNYGMSFIDVGHYRSEDVVIDYLLKILSRHFPKIIFQKSKVFSDRIKYLTE